MTIPQHRRFRRSRARAEGHDSDLFQGWDEYERLTDRGRKVLALANAETQRLKALHLDTEHILLGLAMEGNGVAANVLKNLDVDLIKIRGEVEKLAPQRPDLAPLAKRALEYAMEEVCRLNHNYAGTEHILLGLLRVQEGAAPRVLVMLGLTLEEVRTEVLNLLGHRD